MAPRSINLLPESLLVRRAARRRVRLWAVGAAAAATLSVLAAGAYAVSASTPTLQWTESLHAERAKVADLNLVVEQRSRDIGALSRDLQMRMRITACPNWSGLLAAIADRVGPRARLDRFVLQPKREPGADESAPATAYLLSLSGLTESTKTLSELLLRLEGLAVFERVELVASTTERDKDDRERTRFEVFCLLQDQPLSSALPSAPANAAGDER